MPKLNNCIAAAVDGTWFTTEENLAAFHNVNPTIQIIRRGQKLTIEKRSMIVSGSKGTVTGFHRNAKGTLIVEINWLAGAPPLRIAIKNLQRYAPDKVWMVIPYNPQYRDQSTSFTSSARRNGTSPAVNRFSSRQAAEAWVNSERRIAGWDNYLILESVGMATPGEFLYHQE